MDGDPNSAITVTGTDKKEKDDERTARKSRAAMYLAPMQEFTEVTDRPSDAMTAGAGPVEPNRYDVPERVHDRLHNLSIKGLNFGLINGFLNSNKSTNQPLNNHWRENRGMGGIKSTGTFIQLPSEITYKSRFYKLDDDPKTVRKDPEKLSEEEKKTDQLYIVGSDDGYIYALDANPDNARKVGSDTDTKLQTFLGRVVWTFRAAVKVPVYTEKSGSSLSPSGPIPTRPASRMWSPCRTATATCAWTTRASRRKTDWEPSWRQPRVSSVTPFNPAPWARAC